MLRRSSIPDISDIFIKIPKSQTLKAWEPFHWCKSTLFELDNSEIDEEHPEWLLNWVFGVTMLRTVGHVLDKVDKSRSAKHSSSISSRWNEWKSDKKNHWIFHEFIEKERNSILKVFKLGVQLDKEGIWHEELGMDGVQLFRVATYWWREELEAIETALA